MPGNLRKDEERKIYAIIFEGIRVAALLHDIGHPPYSHISENALNILYYDIMGKKEKNEREKEFCDVLDGMVGEDHQLHEEMGLKISSMLLMGAIPNVSYDDKIPDEDYGEQIYRIRVLIWDIRSMTG